ncbi:MAG: YmdB family metallophosphoesterase [Rhodospirillaceae bacterium]|jgi:2',3'-cyclic-nucleotide 2'-phosphodiesterase|nr:YmdB family metallophosphoesterase [Rhodospirillaceae bacterium]MBT4220163.1 YmdB family metallophosphoesterase [Rhodospirillaceae bacterium]MBT4463262.1 YmdB family metallophosphoesterase [Rhodospirillaceae bacterium]MBT5307810.1 YmdB family metallophosphoesterase [Rhodospirillaceae bacterium]MBT6407566.1 YmdB family metallophosphoesterase [Rhodospirillaceae bacterium]
MKILCCGDVIGRSGRKVIEDNIPGLRDRMDLDFVLVNGENAAHGFGITEKICRSFYDVGVDAITTGNHVWDQREIMNTIDGDPRLLRPLNYPKGTPGTGVAEFEARNGAKVLVVHPMGRLFMNPLDDPFLGVDKALEKQRLGDTVNAIIVDMHAEATSEKMGMGHHCDGRASVVVGSHSHIPTADAQILPGGTAYQTDMGMCGDYDSVIGMQKANAVARFTSHMPTGRLEPANGEATLCAVYVETDDDTGLATTVRPVRIGGRLAGTEEG